MANKLSGIAFMVQPLISTREPYVVYLPVARATCFSIVANRSSKSRNCDVAAAITTWLVPARSMIRF